MLLALSRLLLLAPALTFGLGAAFVLSLFRLGSSPADPAAWQAFLTLGPMIRQPVNLVAGLPGAGYAAALAVFALAALIGCALAFLPGRRVRLRFIYAHLAFLTLFYSMCGEALVAAGNSPDTTVAGYRLDWTIDLSRFPMGGVALFVLVVTSCAMTHLPVLMRVRAELAARSRAGSGRSGRPR